MFRSLSSFFFPSFCVLCKRLLNPVELRLCLPCLASIPYYPHWDHRDNSVFKTFWGRFPLCWGTSLMRMQPNGHSKQLIHWIKYRNDRVLARWLGRQFALRLRTCRHFEIPEVIVPVPLHPKKFKIRGYNQSEEIARGMAEVFEVGVETNSVERIRYQESQTGRDRSARWEALAGSMRCTDPTPLEGKRVLLVDDVITTGATMSALGECLAKVERIELWVCSLIIVD